MSKQGNERDLLAMYIRYSSESLQFLISVYQKAVADMFNQSPKAL